MIKFGMPARPGAARRLGDHACLEVALMSVGKIVFGGTPEALTARGAGHGDGGPPLEQGYSAVLSAARS